MAGGRRQPPGDWLRTGGLLEQVATWMITGARLLAVGWWRYKYAEGENRGLGDKGVGVRTNGLGLLSEVMKILCN